MDVRFQTVAVEDLLVSAWSASLRLGDLDARCIAAAGTTVADGRGGRALTRRCYLSHLETPHEIWLLFRLSRALASLGVCAAEKQMRQL